jgi:hypothetical protein
MSVKSLRAAGGRLTPRVSPQSPGGLQATGASRQALAPDGPRAPGCQPRPTNGMAVGSSVIASALDVSGRLAM